MQTTVIDQIAAAPTSSRLTRETKADRGFEDVLDALVEPTRGTIADAPVRREPQSAEHVRDRRRPEAKDDPDTPRAPADTVDMEVRDSAAATRAEAGPVPDASSQTSSAAASDAGDSTAASTTTDPSETAAPTDALAAPVTPIAAGSGTTDSVPIPTTVSAAPVASGTAGAETGDGDDSAPPVDANATEIGAAAAAAPALAFESEVDSPIADGEPVAQPTRPGNAPAEPPGQRIAALAPEIRGTELASIAADKTLPNVGSRITANPDGNAMRTSGAPTPAAGGSPRSLVDSGALIAAFADRPTANSAAGAAAGARIETAVPAAAGAAIVPAMSGAEGQFDPAGEHAGLHFGIGNAGAAGAAAGAHTAAGTAQQTFVLRTPAEQVAVQVVRAAGQQIDHLQLTLEPADLGRVDVRLELGPDNRLSLVVTADRPETLDLLQRDARALERALQDAGLKTESDSLSFNLRGEGRNDRDGTRTPAEAPATIEPDAIEAQVPAAQAAHGYRASVPGSLDIRI